MAKKQRQIRPTFTSPMVPNASAPPPPPKFDFIRNELTKMRFKWDLLDDCLGGEHSIKQKAATYLPVPRVDDDIEAGKERYHNYIMRAVFYNVTRRTLDGLVGQVFSRDPSTKLPPSLQILVTDADGAGVSLDQQSKLALSYVMGYGRGALLADYPAVEGPITQAQLDEGLIRPVINLYKPTQVLNWRYKVFGAKRLPILVVIGETYLDETDAFESVLAPQWRVLKLVNIDGKNVYQVELWRKDDTDEARKDGYIYEQYTPLNHQGIPFNEIPFTFLGSLNNDEHVDEPPMYDMATLNIAHYRNSADYEEACFMVGQPTAWFSGLTQEWVEEVFKGKVYLGSRAAIPLPMNAMAGLLQVSANSMPKEAMDQKERQMAALGAKLIVDNSVSRTLGEAQIEEAGESSILATATKNVSAAYMFILKQAAKFVGAIGDDEIEYDLNTDFPASRLTPNDRAQLVKEWHDEAITFEEMRDGLRRGGIATLDNATAKLQIAANPPAAVVRAEKARQEALDTKANQGEPTNAPGGGNQAGQ